MNAIVGGEKERSSDVGEVLGVRAGAVVYVLDHHRAGRRTVAPPQLIVDIEADKVLLVIGGEKQNTVHVREVPGVGTGETPEVRIDIRDHGGAGSGPVALP